MGVASIETVYQEAAGGGSLDQPRFERRGGNVLPPPFNASILLTSWSSCIGNEIGSPCYWLLVVLPSFLLVFVGLLRFFIVVLCFSLVFFVFSPLFFFSVFFAFSLFFFVSPLTNWDTSTLNHWRTLPLENATKKRPFFRHKTRKKKKVLDYIMCSSFTALGRHKPMTRG